MIEKRQISIFVTFSRTFPYGTGTDFIKLSKQQIHELNESWNNDYREIFGFKISDL